MAYFFKGVRPNPSLLSTCYFFYMFFCIIGKPQRQSHIRKKNIRQKHNTHYIFLLSHCFQFDVRPKTWHTHAQYTLYCTAFNGSQFLGCELFFFAQSVTGSVPRNVKNYKLFSVLVNTFSAIFFIFFFQSQVFSLVFSILIFYFTTRQVDNHKKDQFSF